MDRLPVAWLLAFMVCIAAASSGTERSLVVPAPVVVSPSQFFEGNDGPWSSFELRVGTPAQNVRFFPSSSSTSTIVILALACQGQPTNCADSRGGTFDTNTSTTWSDVGIFDLGFETSLGNTDNGDFGFDTVGLGYLGSGGPTVNHTVVAGIAASDFWLGMLGINPRPTNFTTQNDPEPSFLTLLRQQNQIPSLSYSYTAGAPYRFKQVLGSLVIGGYDSSRSASSNVTFSFDSDQTRDLTVGLQSITTNVTGSSTSLLSSGIFAFIDSSIASLYLPVSACQAFESAFGLTYNDTLKLYLVNDTLHSALLSANPSVTFTIGNTLSGGEVNQITLPYASFDLQISLSLGANASRYFPLQRAANETQYTLGRTFLQESHLIVDYERSNFSVNPCVWNASATELIVTVPPLNSSSTTGVNGTDTSSVGKQSKSGISGGAIAGIVVGIVVLAAAVALLVYFFVIVPRRKKAETDYTVDPVVPVADPPKDFLPKDGAVEAGGKEKRDVPELQGGHPDPRHEMGDDTVLSATSGKAELAQGENTLHPHPAEAPDNMIFEMEGSNVPEMDGVHVPAGSESLPTPEKKPEDEKPEDVTHS